MSADARPFYVESRPGGEGTPWVPFSTYAQEDNARKRADDFDMLGVRARILVKCATCSDTHELGECLI
jgi:hypothetical protein